jgi:uncharacterized membrane protein
MSEENDNVAYGVMILFLIFFTATIIFYFASKEPAIALWFLMGVIIGYWYKCISRAIEKKEEELKK